MLKSWDFWDTLVTRCVINPTDIFEIVEARSGIEGFCRERISAEAVSRQGVAETNLERIYEHLPYSADEKSRLKFLEIDSELQLASQVGLNATAFNASDLVLSDMYLCPDVLLKIAEKCSVPITPENLFVSSEHIATKHNGDLFEVAGKVGQIAVHHGDNLHGDVRVPKLKGITSVHYKGALLNRLEASWAKQSKDGKFFSGLVRAARLASHHSLNTKQTEWNIFAQIVAPTLVQFVEWIFIDAENRGIKKIYFLSRDGQILHAIAKKLCATRALHFDCRYLYASRQALHLPGHIDIEESENWLLDNTSTLTLSIVSARAGVPLECFIEIASRYLDVQPDSNLNPQERKLLRAIIRSPDFLERFNSVSRDAFDLTYDYFQQEGLFSEVNEPFAVVDVGWNARMQRSIENIFEKSCLNKEHIHGYYFGLSPHCVYEEGTRVHGYVLDPFEAGKRAGDWLDRYRGMVEFFLGADHPSVHSYIRRREAGVSPFFIKPVPDHELLSLQFRQSAILAYVDRYCALTGLLERPLDDHRQTAIQNLRNFLEQPSPMEAEVFAIYQHSEQQIESNFAPMVRRLKGVEKFKPWSVSEHGMWPEGSHALSGSLWIYRGRKWISSKKKQLGMVC